MQEDPNPAFLAWMTAETEAYTAVHRLHQFTCGGRKAVPLLEIERIMGLRKEADTRFAALRGELGVPAASVAPIVATATRLRKEPMLDLLATARLAMNAASANASARSTTS